MLNLKLIDLSLLLLSVVHMCALVQPSIDVDSRLRYKYPNVERTFQIRLDYIYSASMLCESCIIAMIVLMVKERRRHYFAMSKQRLEQELLEQQLHDSNNNTLSPADAVKKDYLRRQEWKSRRPNLLNIPWETLAWSLLVALYQAIGYTRLNAIMYHFGGTMWDTLDQHMRIQGKFLYHTFIRMPYGMLANIPLNDQFNGIIYEPHLLD